MANTRSIVSVLFTDKMRFTITIIYYSWSCGDGCCGDSGYKYRVIDNKAADPHYNIIAEDSEWEFTSRESQLSKAVEAVETKLGRKAIEGQDYSVEEDYESSDDNNDDDADSGGW